MQLHEVDDRRVETIREVRVHRRGQRWAVWALIGLTWVVTFPRLVPGASDPADHGTFISVADRLRAGDRLYAEVWDNKDPLFYYLLALARSITEYGDILPEVGWLALAAAAAASMARRVGLSHRRAVLAGWVLTPIVLTGTTYVPGMTHLPGTAVALCVLALVLRDRWLAAGTLLGALAFLKLLAIPVALAGVLVVLLRRRSWMGAVRLSVSTAATMGAVVLVMALRGELAAYVDTQLGNVGYSQGDLVNSRWGPVASHLLSAAPQDNRTAALTTVASLVVVVLLASLSHPRRDDAPIAAIAVATLVAALAVVAVTALWPHHVQLLYLPGALAVVALLAAIPDGWLSHLRAGAIVMLVAFLIGGATHPYWYLAATRALASHMASLQGTSPEAQALTAIAPAGRYARLGSNDTNAHARGLQSWDLACRRFHQYPFDPPNALDEVLTCLPTADAVVVDASLRIKPGQDEWNHFVTRAREVLAEGYTCTPATFGELCVRR